MIPAVKHTAAVVTKINDMIRLLSYPNCLNEMVIVRVKEVLTTCYTYRQRSSVKINQALGSLIQTLFVHLCLKKAE